jgi:hypothetical protein
MENKKIALASVENNKIVKIFQIAFGIVCIAIAAFWIVFNISSLKTDITLWFPIIFLTGFGAYQVWAGIGRAAIYIEIGSDLIRLKRNPVLPPVEMSAVEIEKIELFPLSIAFCLKSKKRLLLRFGTTYQDTNEKVTDAIVHFAEVNNIRIEAIEEKI